jgi:hypothetical protein
MKFLKISKQLELILFEEYKWSMIDLNYFHLERAEGLHSPSFKKQNLADSLLQTVI